MWNSTDNWSYGKKCVIQLKIWLFLSYQVQRSIIEVLIENAQSIGMVSESLYHRVQMLSSCFPASEDELDRSCEQLDDTDNSKAGKKKKRRSGSLQGGRLTHWILGDMDRILKMQFATSL